MTRINVGINPKELSTKHLIAEHREIKRIPNAIKNGRFSMEGKPDRFTLGKGHVKFFYDKLLYLKKRYATIHAECVDRGFNVTDFSESFLGIPERHMGDYQPTEEDIATIKQRIKERS